jgi:hypothetical protein
MIHILLFVFTAIFHAGPWYYLLLTAAQLVYVPLVLQLVMRKGDWFHVIYPYLSIPAYLSVAILQITGETQADIFFAAVYLIFTISVAAYGFSRFISRGFTQLEEFAIDMGLFYLMIGGAWFFAHIAELETGFSPIIRFLTSIHFHYASFLLPIFAGLLGRIYKTQFYRISCIILLVSPIIVALGISFSNWLELLSVIFYIIGIYSLIYLSYKAPVSKAKWLIRISFSALGISILFSFAYALGNVWGLFTISIDFMLKFHGILNCGLFALFGVIGWSIFTPSPQNSRRFPITRIRGKRVIGEKILEDITDNDSLKLSGLIDDISIYEPDVSPKFLRPAIVDFYENTNQYRLFAEIIWHNWFKPFAAVYCVISRYIQQINLPLSKRQIEMTGDVFPIKGNIDGREQVRAWVRKVNGETAFVALYSHHQSEGKRYMNIALPLPGAAMVGILELKQLGQTLQLSSKREKPESDSGVYLAFGKTVFKLPIEEVFHVEQIKEGELKAKHKMWIFAVPFLTIDYSIGRK